MNNILTEYGAMVWLAWYCSETVPPTDTSVLKKHVLLFSCLKKTCSLVKQMACVVRFGDRTSYYISYLKSVIIKNQRKI
jgi:hypothetical protein